MLMGRDKFRDVLWSCSSLPYYCTGVITLSWPNSILGGLISSNVILLSYALTYSYGYCDLSRSAL